MFTLLYIGILLAALVTVVMVHAVATAPEGYEDLGGFHRLVARGGAAGSESGVVEKPKAPERDLPPLMLSR